MKSFYLSFSISMAAVIDHVLAYPGMAAKLNEVSKLIKRNNPVDTNVLLGDLAKGHTTIAGTTIFDCLADKIDCYDTTVKVSPNSKRLIVDVRYSQLL